MSAIFMGNQPTTKVEEKVSIALEQLVRLWIECGLEPDALDYIHCRGPQMEKILVEGTYLYNILLIIF